MTVCRTGRLRFELGMEELVLAVAGVTRTAEAGGVVIFFCPNITRAMLPLTVCFGVSLAAGAAGVVEGCDPGAEGASSSLGKNASSQSLLHGLYRILQIN